MRIAVGSDHRGYSVRNHIIELLTQLGHEVVDMGTDTAEPIDYTDIAAKAAKEVGSGGVEMGILVCGTGLGMSITANKFVGVRAAPCHDALTAEMSRRHNNLNMLCLSADLLGEKLIDRMVELWINTPFDGDRHTRRVERISEIEHEIRAERAEAE
ncbi:MAG: ribose 5-phosphate isomerase B [Planctomycetota bacterium]|nr:ribose 5-phosphate isomerase B [Planctomycetota bacterium]